MADLNELEHKQMNKDLDTANRRIEDQYKTWESFIVSQNERDAELRRFITERTDNVVAACNAMTENGHTVLQNMHKVAQDVREIKEDRKEDRDKLIAIETSTRSVLTWKDRHDVVHETIEDRIAELEKTSGRIALKTLVALGVPLGLAFVVWLLSILGIKVKL